MHVEARAVSQLAHVRHRPLTHPAATIAFCCCHMRVHHALVPASHLHAVLGCHRGVEHKEEVTAEGWEAMLRVPWDLIRNPDGEHTRHAGRLWRVNFYRTDKRKGTTAQEFSAWSATMQSPAAFHVSPLPHFPLISQ